MTAPLCRGLAAAAGLALTSAALVALGRGPLATPPVGSWPTVVRWYEVVGPTTAVMALVRVVALLLALWLFMATVLQLLRAAISLASLERLADLVSPRSLQRLGHGLAGLSLTAGLAAPAPSAGWFDPANVVSVSVVDDPPLPPAPAAQPAWPAGEGAATPGTAIMRLLRDGAPVAAPSPDVVTVAVGDSLWSLAAEELGAIAGSPASDREVAAYWRQVIAANRSVLVDPGNPDLIYPGQVVTLPLRET